MFKYTLPIHYSKSPPHVRKAVRNQYVQEQGGLCYWCKHALSEEPPERIKKYKINWKLFPPNFLKHPVHLQHDHDSDLTEGAVHALCNAVMWQYHGR